MALSVVGSEKAPAFGIEAGCTECYGRYFPDRKLLGTILIHLL